MAKCSQCNKTATWQQESSGMFFCVEHWALIQRTINETNFQLRQDMMHLENQIMDTIGLPRKYVPVVPQHNHFHNTIDVKDSTVGLINTGQIDKLNTNINIIHRQNPKLAFITQELLKTVAENEIPQAKKREITEQVDFLVSEAAKPENQRNLAVATLVLQGLSTVLQGFEFIQNHWVIFESSIKSVLKI